MLSSIGNLSPYDSLCVRLCLCSRFSFVCNRLIVFLVVIAVDLLMSVSARGVDVVQKHTHASRASGAEVRQFDTDQLQHLYDYQNAQLKLIESDVKLAQNYLVALNIHGGGFSDWTWFTCAHIYFHLPTFPSNTLYFSNHSAVGYLREELAFMDWDKHRHFFTNFSNTQPREESEETIMFLQFPKVVNPPIQDFDFTCDAAVWMDLVKPSASVAAKVEEYLRPNEYRLVGVHIRSYWLLVHDTYIYNKNKIRAQDFLDCALSLHKNDEFKNITQTCPHRHKNNVSENTCSSSNLPIRYFIASDSTAITQEWLAKVPNTIAHVGPIVHTGGRGGNESEEAYFKVFVDYFVLKAADFIIQTHGSSWVRLTEYAKVPTLDLVRRPEWCDRLSDTYTMHTFDSDVP